MRKSQLEKLRDAKKKAAGSGGTTTMDLEGLLRLLVIDPITFSRVPPEKRNLNPTQRAFINDPEEVKGYMGAAGAAKTSTLCGAGWLRALLIPGSNGYVSRQNYNDLLGTTGKRMQEMLDRLPRGTLLDRDKSPPMKWYIKPIPQPVFDAEGKQIDLKDEPSIINFMGLEDGLGSIEATWWIVDEADETEKERIQEILGRLRGPAEDERDYMLSLAFNPPDQTHWLYTAATGRDFQGAAVDEQPWIKMYTPEERENEQNLRPGYYDGLLKRLTKDMADRLVRGLWGAVFPGLPVYREFKSNIHVRRELIKKFDPTRPLIRQWDFGYNVPACIFSQMDWLGRMLTFKELIGSKVEAIPFAQNVKSFTATHFPGTTQIVDWGDPAARQKKDTGSTLTHLSKEGVRLMYQTGLHVDTGVKILRNRLMLLIDGEPAQQYDRDGCPMLIRALQGGYHMDDKGVAPKKDGVYEHPADAHRYGITGLFLGSGGHFAMQTGQLPASLAYDPRFDNFRRR